jgi:hypothetical protein
MVLARRAAAAARAMTRIVIHGRAALCNIAGTAKI